MPIDAQVAAEIARMNADHRHLEKRFDKLERETREELKSLSSEVKEMRKELVEKLERIVELQVMQKGGWKAVLGMGSVLLALASMAGFLLKAFVIGK